MFISTPCCLLELLVGCHVSRHHRRVRVVAGPGNLEVRPKNCQRGSQITDDNRDDVTLSRDQN